MLDKYIKLHEKYIIAGQTSGGYWYCKELPAENPGELKLLVGLVNGILNEYNTKKEAKK